MKQKAKRSLWSAAIIATKNNEDSKQIVTTTKALTVKAYSEQEALGLALQECKNQFPESYGYYQHGVSLSSVDLDFIAEVLPPIIESAYNLWKFNRDTR